MAFTHDPGLPLVSTQDHPSRQTYGVILIILLTLFIFRVLGQALVASMDTSWLPPMEHWYSGIIPYPVLLPIQVALIFLMIQIIWNINRGKGRFYRTNASRGVFLKCFSYLYALWMVGRYVVTMTLHPEYRWLGHTIPIWFHFVLAAFIYTCGHYQIAFSSGEKIVRT
jgi:hypothetical protein